MKRIPCERYSRVVGYHRPICNWNKGKKEEFEERKTANWDKIKCQMKSG
jgi:anaerobic ribonucleoside-triphosphate reductase